MSIDRIDSLFHPKAIAVTGASEQPGSLGKAVMHNLSTSGFNGPIFAVNAGQSSIMGQRTYADLQHIETPVDLVVVAGPMNTVPAVIADCARIGVHGAVIVSNGGRPSDPAGRQWETEILKTAADGNVRIIGPHGLGIMCAASGLNASLAPGTPLLGKLAFVSQSRGICAAIMDYSKKEKIGFSHFVGLGSMLDVNFGDIIDYLGAESGVSSILMHMETLTGHRNFMSAARAVSRIKPIIALKAGRTNGRALPAASFTGTLAEEDAIFDAAFQRAGIVRVKTFEELFDTAQILSRKGRYRGPGLAILTNSAGPGVMAVDALADTGMLPAVLPSETLEDLDAVLCDRWTRGNPVNIMADATPERYAEAAAVLARAKGIQALLIMLAPQMLTDAQAVARTLVERLDRTTLPLIACWMGGTDVQAGRQILNHAGLPTFDTPERAMRAFMNLHRHSRGIEMLQQTPARLSRRIIVDRAAAGRVIDTGLAAAPEPLDKTQSKALLEAYGISVAPTAAAASADEAVLAVGARKHPGFGPVILFGLGGVLGDRNGGRAIALPPLNRLLASRLMEAAGANRLMEGYCDQPPADREKLEGILIRLAQLVTDFPQIAELDIHPLAIRGGDPVALDARVVLEQALCAAPLHLCISPYPSQYESRLHLPEVGDLWIRPIRPEDAPLLAQLFDTLSPQSVYYRFFSPMKQLSHAMLARFTQIDYDREIAMVAILESASSEKMLGAARVMLQHNLKDAEFAVLVGDTWQGRGIGAHLLRNCLKIAEERGFGKIWGTVLAENRHMLALGKKLGFTIKRAEQAGEFDLTLDMSRPGT
ncbi:GNAT family N-acetyltransferase [uncultured Desulfosarcina sp.]|uniref:bifunctional acetate--CoA ligase family protein/GNAT family N-acetyltransferase n=1 Tax=uncultured Desulfosarcina sp. TaxID=218289 RepID=UPI0029C884E4|nr:GNAT family N-acetyltransferase [uncultured Desulfosarcina sp.]